MQILPFTKVSSYIKCKTTKFLNDNIGENLYDLGFGDKFLDTTQKRKINERKNKFDFIKIKLAL